MGEAEAGPPGAGLGMAARHPAAPSFSIASRLPALRRDLWWVTALFCVATVATNLGDWAGRPPRVDCSGRGAAGTLAGQEATAERSRRRQRLLSRRP